MPSAHASGSRAMKTESLLGGTTGASRETTAVPAPIGQRNEAVSHHEIPHHHHHHPLRQPATSRAGIRHACNDVQRPGPKPERPAAGARSGGDNGSWVSGARTTSFENSPNVIVFLCVLGAYAVWRLWRAHVAAVQFDRDAARGLEQSLRKLRRTQCIECGGDGCMVCGGNHL